MPSRYKYTKMTKNKEGRRVFRPTMYPSIPIRDSDIFIYPRFGDRLDNLAFKYYNDVSLWWIIAKANDIRDGSFALSPTEKLRIPKNISQIISDLRSINEDF